MRIARLRISHGHPDLHGADRRKKSGMIGNDFAVDRLASHGFIMADQIGDAIACGFIAVAHPHSSQIREGIADHTEFKIIQTGNPAIDEQELSRIKMSEGRPGPVLRHIAFQPARSEEHTSELQSLMRISYAVFCLKKKKTN